MASQELNDLFLSDSTCEQLFKIGFAKRCIAYRPVRDGSQIVFGYSNPIHRNNNKELCLITPEQAYEWFRTQGIEIIVFPKKKIGDSMFYAYTIVDTASTEDGTTFDNLTFGVFNLYPNPIVTLEKAIDEAIAFILPKEPEFSRAGGECICDKCNKEYVMHPTHPRWHWLNKLCDGSLVKL